MMLKNSLTEPMKSITCIVFAEEAGIGHAECGQSTRRLPAEAVARKCGHGIRQAVQLCSHQDCGGIHWQTPTDPLQPLQALRGEDDGRRGHGPDQRQAGRFCGHVGNVRHGEHHAHGEEAEGGVLLGGNLRLVPLHGRCLPGHGLPQQGLQDLLQPNLENVGGRD